MCLTKKKVYACLNDKKPFYIVQGLFDLSKVK